MLKKFHFLSLFYRFPEISYSQPLKNKDNTNPRKLFGSRSVLGVAEQRMLVKVSKLWMNLLTFRYFGIS